MVWSNRFRAVQWVGAGVYGQVKWYGTAVWELLSGLEQD